MGDVELHELTTADVLSCLDRLASHGRSPSTVAFYLQFFRRVCAWGTKQKFLPYDPCAGMELPKENTPPLRVLSEAEEKALCSALGEPYALWVRLAILTGLKQSEQFTLRWRDIDLQRGSLLLPHPTTGALSSLPLNAEAVSLLTQLRQLHPPFIELGLDRSLCSACLLYQ